MAPDDVPSRFSVDFTGATLLGNFRVEKKIADGGMGSVWLGVDTNLGRRVVVKVPHVRFLGESGFRARFTREITELVRLEHPNIVRILAQGTYEEIPFFVLQFLGGGSLEERLRQAGDGPRDVELVVPWLPTIAATLDFIHGRGVVHRDVKPENILFDEDGHVFLSDFGVVKALDEDLSVTEAGTGVGSPKYMAPEQGLGRSVEGSADQYGLATTVYESIAGRLPFEGGSALEILLNKQKESPTHLADLVPDLPTSCADAVMLGLAADPEERFPSCQDFTDAFLAGAGMVAGTPPRGTVDAGEPRESSTGRRLFATATTAVLIAAAVLSVGFAAGWFSPGSSAPAGDASEVILLSPGTEPRRLLRYRPAPGTREITAIGIATEESKRLGDQEPVETSLPRVSFRLKLETTGVARNGDITFAWECLETRLEAAEGTPPAVQGAMRAVAKSIEGRRGSGRQSARGLHGDISHDGPPPEEAPVQPLFALLTEIMEQVSTPLPKDPVGIGARWEVTTAKNHIEGIRITQTVTYELESLRKNEARLRIYIVVAALSQSFEHPELPADSDARMKSVHGDGEGELVIDLDRLGDRSLRMAVESRAQLFVTVGAEDRELSVTRTIRFRTERE